MLNIPKAEDAKAVDKIIEELRAAGYRVKRESYRDSSEISIDFRWMVVR